MKKITKEEVIKEEVVEISQEEFTELCSDIMSSFITECVEDNTHVGDVFHDIACVAAFASCLADAIFDDSNYTNDNEEESEEE